MLMLTMPYAPLICLRLSDGEFTRRYERYAPYGGRRRLISDTSGMMMFRCLFTRLRLIDYIDVIADVCFDLLRDCLRAPR